MESIFNQDPNESEAPEDNYDKIGEEIAHLRKREPIRTQQQGSVALAKLIVGILFCALVALFLMDPFFYAYQKGQAIKAYIFLNNYGMKTKAQALANTGMFTPDEIATMNRRATNPTDFASLQEARDAADGVLQFISNQDKLQRGQSDDLDTLGKLRCTLFVSLGLKPPTEWPPLNPKVETDEQIAAKTGVTPGGTNALTSVNPITAISGAANTMGTVNSALQGQLGNGNGNSGGGDQQPHQ